MKTYILFMYTPLPPAKTLIGTNENCSSGKHMNLKYKAAVQKLFRGFVVLSWSLQEATVHCLSFMLCIFILRFQKRYVVGSW